MKENKYIYILSFIVFGIHILLGYLYKISMFYNQNIFLIIESGIVGMLLINIYISNIMKTFAIEAKKLIMEYEKK
jgi:NADH:ubiquinone oxidoreductase subunit 3 (subunit A)